MAFNKLVFNGDVKIDLTDSTITQDLVEKGTVFYDASGTRRVGIAKSYIPADYADTDLDGMTILYEGSDLVFDGTNYIDTNVALFSSENMDKDFRIIIEGIYIDNTKGSGSAGERCLLGSMYEVSPYPGFIIRATTNAGSGVVAIENKHYCSLLTISRINGTMIFSAVGVIGGTVTNPKGNMTIGGTVARAGNMSNCTTTHNTTITLGCEKDKNGNVYRFCGGSMEHIIIAMAE